MSQARKAAKFRRDYRKEVISRKVKPLEIRESEEAAIGVNGPNKTAATEVKFNNMASQLITFHSIP